MSRNKGNLFENCFQSRAGHNAKILRGEGVWQVEAKARGPAGRRANKEKTVRGGDAEKTVRGGDAQRGADSCRVHSFSNFLDNDQK